MDGWADGYQFVRDFDVKSGCKEIGVKTDFKKLT
jgi:hypothetical protein